MDIVFSEMGESEDPRIQAIIEHYAYDQDQSVEIYEATYDYFGMPVYDTPNGDIVVATYNEIDNAKEDKARSYIGDVGNEIVNYFGRVEDYIEINDIDTIASEDADRRIEDMSDEDIIEDGKRYDNIKPNVDEYYETKDEISNIEDEVNDLDNEHDEDKIETDEYVKTLDELNDKSKQLEKKADNLLYKIRYALRDEYEEEEASRMKDNPVDWLKEFGYWTKDGLDPDAVERGIVSIDTDRMAEDMASEYDIEDVAPQGDYNEITIGGENYFLMEY